MSNTDYTNISAAIYGCEGTRLSDEEKHFFRTHAPYGFILFARNCQSPEQVKALVQDFYDATGRDWLPILIDQEGGRVARLTPPHWRASPPAGIFADLALQQLDQAVQATYLNARLIAAELHDLGITVNCAPLLDLPVEGAHSIIGDRAFGQTPLTVVALAEAQIRGFLEMNVLPIIKHIPGHGRATADSHEKLPIVDTPLETMRATDFLPFKALNTAPYAMTAHIQYTAIDPDHVATLSPTAIQMIREEIGFQGLLMTDDLSMHALQGSFYERTERALQAGCDLILHCNGNMQEMQAIAEAVPMLTTRTARLALAVQAAAQSPAEPFDKDEAEHALSQLIPAYQAA